MRERRKVARSPQRTFFWHNWHDVRIDEIKNALDKERTHPAIPHRERIGPQNHHCPHNFRRKRLTLATCMAHNEVFLKKRIIFIGNGHIAELSESRRNSIFYKLFFDREFDYFPGSAHSLFGIGVEPHRYLVPRDNDKLRDGK